MTTSRRRAAVAAGAGAIIAVLVSCTPGQPGRAISGQGPVAGAGDLYYPELGNPGYHAGHYTLDLAINPVQGSLAGTAAITAVASRELSRISFDLVGLVVGQVTVDGAQAAASRDRGKLVIVPARPVAAGHTFTVVVGYQGIAHPITDVSGSNTGAAQVGWHHAAGQVYVASEVGGARTWFPVNDTPRDKATYTFHITVPADYTAVANGLPQGTSRHGASTTFSWESRYPMASYLATVDVARFTRLTSTGPRNLPILSYAPPALAQRARTVFADLPQMISYFEHILGPYPFESAGEIIVTPAFRWALETQTRPLSGSQILTLNQATAQEGISHELAHQWFGDSVSLSNWRDIWLNEGFATYLSWLWLAHHGDGAYLTGLMRTQYGYETNAQDYAALLSNPHLPPAQILAILHRQFLPAGQPVSDRQTLAAMGLTAASQLTTRKALGLLGVRPGSADAAGYLEQARSSAPADPPRADLFTSAVYNRGAMTLQALRERAGDPVFFRILRTYVARYQYRNATTADFITVADQVSHQNLRAFFTRWLDAPAAPPMPPLLPGQ